MSNSLFCRSMLGWFILTFIGCGGRSVELDDTIEQGGTGGTTTSKGGASFGGTSRSTPMLIANGGATIYSTYFASGGSTYYVVSGGTTARGGSSYVTSSGNTTGRGGSSYGGSKTSGGTTYGGTSSSSLGGKPVTGGSSSGGLLVGGATTTLRGGSSGSVATSGKPATGGTTAITTPGSAGYVSTAGRTGFGGFAGANAGDAGSAGTANCPLYDCAIACPVGSWPDPITGCQTCACAPPDKTFSYDTSACAASALTVAVTATKQTSPENRWLFDFVWKCSDAATGLTVASVGVGIYNNASSPIVAANQTVMYRVIVSSVPITFVDPAITMVVSSTTVSATLTPSDGAYLSVRRDGDTFTGGLYLPATVASVSGTVMLAASFSVPVPL